jgi:hypothetical protein
MELLYIDESGDNGFSPGSSEYFILAGLSIDSQNWKEYFWKIKNLKQKVSQKFGLIAPEIKGAELFNHRGPLFNSLVSSHKDLAWIYESYVELLCDPMVNLFVMSQSKREFKKKIQEENRKKLTKIFNIWLWTEYLSKYEEYLWEKSRESGYPQTGLAYFDENPSQKKYVNLIFKKFSMRFNQESKFPGYGFIENIIFCDSKISYFIQLADILAYSVNKLKIKNERQGAFRISPSVETKLYDKIKMNS